MQRGWLSTILSTTWRLTPFLSDSCSAARSPPQPSSRLLLQLLKSHMWLIRHQAKTWSAKSPIFCENWDNPQNINFTEEGGSVLHITDALRGRTSATDFGYSWRRSYHLFTYHRGPSVEWFATSNSVNSKWQLVPLFLQNWGEIFYVQSGHQMERNLNVTLYNKLKSL